MQNIKPGDLRKGQTITVGGTSPGNPFANVGGTSGTVLGEPWEVDSAWYVAVEFRNDEVRPIRLSEITLGI